MKPPCGTLKFKLLLDQYLTDGFCTGHEPLLINFPAELSAQNLDQMWSGVPGKDWMGVRRRRRTRRNEEGVFFTTNMSVDARSARILENHWC